MTKLSDDDDFQDPELALVKQFPKPPPEPPCMETDSLDEVFYPDGPPQVIPIPLMKDKYVNRETALLRAKAVCELRGLRFLRMFDTARAFVVHAYKVTR
jgi:hypothetical protein